MLFAVEETSTLQGYTNSLEKTGRASDYKMCRNEIDEGELLLRKVHSLLENHNIATSLGGESGSQV